MRLLCASQQSGTLTPLSPGPKPAPPTASAATSTTTWATLKRVEVRQEAQEKREQFRAAAEKIGNDSPIICLARQLHLRLRPSGNDEYSWKAPCPRNHHEPEHELSISARTESFSCIHCGKGGGSGDLKNFYEETLKLNFAPLVEILEEQAGSMKGVKQIYVTVSWYYGNIAPTLKLDKTELQQILQGVPLSKDGRGYWSEEGFCHDVWLFNFNWPGSLDVEYDDGGQGFIGNFEHADIEAMDRIFLRVPASLKRKVEKASLANGSTITAFAVKALEAAAKE